MKLFSPDDELPEPNTYVLVHLNITNWGDADDPKGNRYWRVAKFLKGITGEERELLDDNDRRKRTWKAADEGHNNRRGYCWDEFGPHLHFGQDVDKWAYLTF